MKLRRRIASVILGSIPIACSTAGCTKADIRVYLAPRDEPRTAEEKPDAPRAKPKITYALPAGWQEASPGAANVAAFLIRSGSTAANVAVTPLPNLAGREEMIVNLWRDQAGLPPIGEADAANELVAVEIAGQQGKMFDVLGTREGGEPLRILTAFFHAGGSSWFFKLSGDDALVTAQKPAFVEFLKSVRVGSETTTASGTGDPPAGSGTGVPPVGWTRLQPGNMQIAKFAVPEKDGAKAEVSVSVFPSDTGGTLANVNRWRKQIGLADFDEAALPTVTKPIDGAPGAVLVDLRSDARALLGAIVPRNGQWYFYKLLGDASAVDAAREQFIEFVKRAK
jgi:hypothetical protein